MSTKIADDPMRITINKRYMRSQMILGAVMQIVDKYICRHHPQNLHRDCCRELFDLFMDKGVTIITEEQRTAAGLAPRDENGLTEDELAAIEAKLHAAMLNPNPPMIFKP